MHASIDEIRAALEALPQAKRQEIAAAAIQLVGKRRWTPNPGPQTEAYESDADEIFYGGQAGGGKTDLACGLALEEHSRSLILRRYRDDAKEMSDRLLEIAGARSGWNGQDLLYREKTKDGERLVRFAGCMTEEDKQRHKGKPYDLYVFDEVSDFLESQYTFITIWNRSAKPGQRCRILATGNPPTTPEGLWVLKRWAAWLDPSHPNPAKPGELRWYVRGPDDREIEVDGPGPHMIEGEELRARSRTYIPAALSDNPDLADTDYRASLDLLPEELRAAYRDGRFDAGLKDRPYQCIPTAWVRLAMSKWTPEGRSVLPMTCIGVDASGGGDDPMAIARRHGHWYDKLVEVAGHTIPMDRAGPHTAGLVVSYRRDDPDMVVDLGGGYGSSMYEQLKKNFPTKTFGYKGAAGASGKDLSGKLGFLNARSAAIWRVREALDPGQPGGQRMILPDDPELLADLTAPTYKPDGKVIVVEPKADVVQRLGRSPNKGDAVVMAWTKGLKDANVPGGMDRHVRSSAPQVVGSIARRRRR